jgi:hydrogenase maturation protease
MTKGRVLIIGVGNEFRGDDAVGLEAAKRLDGKVPGDAIVLRHSGDGVGLVEAWKTSDSVVVIDAMRSGRPVGSVVRYEVGLTPDFKQKSNASSHGFGVSESVELARAMGRLPKSLVIYGIEAANFGLGSDMSPMVEKAIDAAVEAVVKEIECTSLV